MRRLIIWLVILGVLGGLGAAAFSPAKAWWETRLIPKYITAQVSRGKVETVVNSTGTIKPVRTVSVGAFTSGPIKYIYVDYNSKVSKGGWFDPPTQLALIDPKLLQAAVDQDLAAIDAQKADRDRVQALLDQAKNNEDRAMKLYAINKDYISDTEMDQYVFSRKTLEAQLKLAQASIKQAEVKATYSRDNLAYTKIISPENGVIIERKVDPGQTVVSSYQTAELFTVGVEMDQHMYIYASVDEADIGFIRRAKDEGRPVEFTVDAYPGDLFKGKIKEIRLNATTTQNVVTYPVIIETPNADLRLLPNMTANISFQTEIRENVLRIPAAALRFMPQPYQVRPEDRHYVDTQPANSSEATPKRTAAEKAEQARNRQHRRVWVQDGRLLRAVPVTLGLIENQNAEIIEADLKEGDALVTGIEVLYVPR
jgi:HlyD family secretion protein